jgi:hypothetical protein
MSVNVSPKSQSGDQGSPIVLNDLSEDVVSNDKNEIELNSDQFNNKSNLLDEDRTLDASPIKQKDFIRMNKQSLKKSKTDDIKKIDSKDLEDKNTENEEKKPAKKLDPIVDKMSTSVDVNDPETPHGSGLIRLNSERAFQSTRKREPSSNFKKASKIAEAETQPEKFKDKTRSKRSASRQQERANSPEIITSIKSQQVLASKFIKQYNDILEVLNINTDELDLNSTIEILQKLAFIKNDPNSLNFEEETLMVLKFWKMIGGEGNEGKIKKQNLLSVCLDIMNLYTPVIFVPDTKNHSFKTWREINGIYVFSRDEALKIHRMFFSFYQNRQNLSKKKVEKEVAPETYPFRPEINKESDYLAKERQKKVGSLNSNQRDEYIQKEKKRIEEKREKFIKDKQETEILQCTFKPKILPRSFSIAKNPPKENPNLNVDKKPIQPLEPSKKTASVDKNQSSRPDIGTEKLKTQHAVRKASCRGKIVQPDKLELSSANESLKKKLHQKSNSFSMEDNKLINSPIKPNSSKPDKRDSKNFIISVNSPKIQNKDIKNEVFNKKNSKSITEELKVNRILKNDEKNSTGTDSSLTIKETSSRDQNLMSRTYTDSIEVKNSFENLETIGISPTVHKPIVKSRTTTEKYIALGNFITEHNLSEDAAEQLRKLLFL